MQLRQWCHVSRWLSSVDRPAENLLGTARSPALLPKQSGNRLLRRELAGGRRRRSALDAVHEGWTLTCWHRRVASMTSTEECTTDPHRPRHYAFGCRSAQHPLVL